MKAVLSEQAPSPVGPYSQAIDTGTFVFCSGQLGLDPSTGTLVGSGAEEQTIQAMRNLAAVLKACGLGLSNVVKTTVFLSDPADLKEVSMAYGGQISTPPPARSMMVVLDLPLGARVMIEAVAVRA